MYVIVLAWLLGFFASIVIVLPFVAVSHVRKFANSASCEINGV